MAYEMKGTLLYSDTGIRAAYDPIIYEHFNNEVSFYAKTKKRPADSVTYNFIARVTRNTMVGAKASTDDLIGGSSGRINLTHLLKQYAAAVAIEDLRVVEASKNGIGKLADAWATELNDTLIDLSKNLNSAFFGTGLSTTGPGSVVDGLRGLLVTTGSVYGQLRSSYTSLTPNVNDSVTDLSLADLRGFITTCKTAGAKNLVIWTTPTVSNYLKNKMEAAKYYMGPSLMAGFEGNFSFDGYPIIEDVDCTAGFMFILDLDSHYIAEFIPFQMGVKELGKTNLTDTKYIWGVLDLIFTRFDTSYKLGGITS
jgi:hypothetical protein